MPADFRPALLALSTTCVLTALSAANAGEDETARGLQQQRQQMPAEFRQHLFGTPLSVRVELDGTFLGDAEVVLSEDDRVQLLAFGESHDSPLPAEERERLASQLAEPVLLGRCHSQCRGLSAVHYSVENSLLSVLTEAGSHTKIDSRYLVQPETGSTGLILRNNLTYSGGRQQESTLRYGAALQGSLGQWTMAGDYQYYHTNAASHVGGHYISALYAQREFRDNFLRVGYFLPTFQGVTRQPRAPGTQNYTSVGIMAGSSDALLSDYGSEAVYPVYVTASLQGVVEIYRDGNLISTQPVVAGMQAIDTRRLPGGIYDVELRVVENGVIVSSQSAAIHKPSGWRNPSRRWRYSGFAGQQQGLLDSGNDPQQGKLAAGAVVNYLVHPRVVGGATVQQVGQRRSTGVSLDWQANDRFNLYTNLYDSTDAGRGLDAQGMFRYGNGSVVLSHARSWVEQRERMIAGPGRPPRWKTYGGWQDSSSLSLNHRFGELDSLSFMVAASAVIR
jgi:hypothetical protein